MVKIAINGHKNTKNCSNKTHDVWQLAHSIMPFPKEILRYIVCKVKTIFDDKWSEKIVAVTKEEILNVSHSGIGSRLLSSKASAFSDGSNSSSSLFGASSSSLTNTSVVYSLEIYHTKDEQQIRNAIAATTSMQQQHSSQHKNNSKSTTTLEPKKKAILHRDIRIMSGKELTNRLNTLIVFFEQPLYLNFKKESEFKEWFEYLTKLINVEESGMKEGICAIIESITDACVVSDADGIITGFNAQAEKLFGYSKEEVVDTNVNVSILMPDSYAKYHQQILNRYNKHRNRVIIGKPRNFLAKHKLGHKIPITINLGEVQDSNPQSKFRYIAMFRDSMTKVVISSTSDPAAHDTQRCTDKLKIQIQRKTKTEISKFDEDTLRMVEDLLKLLQSMATTINILETEKERLDQLTLELQERETIAEKHLNETQKISPIYQIYKYLTDHMSDIESLTIKAQDQLTRDCILCWKQIQMYKKATRACDQFNKFKSIMSNAGELTTRRARAGSIASYSEALNGSSSSEQRFESITKPEVVSMAVQLFDRFLVNYEKGETPISKNRSISPAHNNSTVIRIVTREVLPVIKNTLLKWSTSSIENLPITISTELFYFVEKDILEFLKNDPIKNIQVI